MFTETAFKSRLSPLRPSEQDYLTWLPAPVELWDDLPILFLFYLGLHYKFPLPQRALLLWLPQLFFPVPLRYLWKTGHQESRSFTRHEEWLWNWCSANRSAMCMMNANIFHHCKAAASIFKHNDQFCSLASSWTSVNTLLRGLTVCSFAIKAKT